VAFAARKFPFNQIDSMKTKILSSSGLKLAFVAAFVAGVFAFTGCRTMEGAGKDLEKAGEGIQDAAK